MHFHGHSFLGSVLYARMMHCLGYRNEGKITVCGLQIMHHFLQNKIVLDCKNSKNTP